MTDYDGPSGWQIELGEGRKYCQQIIPAVKFRLG
jgi:hypothetical protein